MISEQVRDISADDLKNRMQRREKAYLIVDARDVNDYYRGHIPGACSLFDGEMSSLAQSLDKNADIVVYGPGQPRGESQNPMDRLSGDAINKLRGMGFKNVMELRGGLTSWTMAGNRLDKSEPGSLKPAQVPFMSSAESGTRDTSGGAGGG
jgi:rhodanese-related sulfurtransferase